MQKASKTLKQLRKASALSKRTMHKNGPKSFKKGMGALVKVVYKRGGTLSAHELIEILGFNRAELKTVVRKAETAGYVELKDIEGKRAYEVKITHKGSEIAEKRLAANERAAEKLLETFTNEEIDQLNMLTEKLVVSAKACGAHGAYKYGKKSHKHSSKKRGHGRHGKDIYDKKNHRC